MTELDLNAHYTVSDYSDGIAWYTRGYELIRDADYEWTGIETEDTTRVRMVMVGDDREFIYDIEDITVIPEDSFCRGCGQVGCTHEVWE